MPDLTAASPLGRVLLVIAAVSTLLSAESRAQNSSDRSLIELEALREERGREQQQAALRGGLTGAGAAIPLETALDPATYVLGPGDTFGVSIGGAIPIQFLVPVAADGTLVIPDAGRFEAAGRTLAAVQREVESGLQRAFRNVQTAVVLAQPRPFLVHVAGSVPRPGRHAVRPAARVEDALVIALEGASPLEAVQASDPFAIALRSVLLERADGASEVLDLRRYYALGDLSQNPMLRGGDVLRVRSFLQENGVRVEGAVPQGGVFDLRPGDTAVDLLALALADTDLSVLGPVRYVSRGAKEGRPLAPSEWSTVQLQPGDRLLVAEAEPDAGEAEVAGRVVFPGTFPITIGTTSVGDLVEMAGGFRRDALRSGLYLERRGTRDESELGGTALRRRQASFVDATTFEQLLAAESSSAVTGSLSFSGRQYLAAQRLRYPRVALSAGPAGLDAASAEVLIRDGDRLVVPTDVGGVLVLGQVGMPGYVPYLPGADAAYYVAQAGGRVAGAADVFVQSAPTQPYERSDAVPVEPGAVVFVDREAVGETLAQQQVLVQESQFDLQEQREAREARYRLLTTGLQVVSTAVAVVTTYLLIDRN